jgi:hypothetical protein
LKVDPSHGRCRDCGGSLDIVDADDATMTVECQYGHCYAVEPDAFGDGCMIYYLQVMSERLEGGAA